MKRWACVSEGDLEKLLRMPSTLIPARSVCKVFSHGAVKNVLLVRLLSYHVCNIGIICSFIHILSASTLPKYTGGVHWSCLSRLSRADGSTSYQILDIPLVACNQPCWEYSHHGHAGGVHTMATVGVFTPRPCWEYSHHGHAGSIHITAMLGVFTPQTLASAKHQGLFFPLRASH